MTFPTFASDTTLLNESSSTTGARTLTISGLGLAAGDLLLILVGCDGNPTLTWAGNDAMTALTAKAANGSTFCAETRYRICTGSETSFTISTGATSEAMQVRALRITGWHGTTPPETVAFATGSSVSPNPGSLNPAAWDVEDTLWIAVETHDSTATLSGYPANYGSNQRFVAGAVAAGGMGVATRNLAAASDDPGVFTIATEQWLATTIAVRPASGGAGAVLAGSFAAVAAFGGTLALTGVLAGSFAAAAGFAGSLRLGPAPLAGSFAGVATFGANLSGPPVVLAGSFAGSSTFGAKLKLTARLAGSVPAFGSFTAALFAPGPPGCEVAGVFWDLRMDLGELAFVLNRDELNRSASLLNPADAVMTTRLGDRILSATWTWGPTSTLGPLTEPSAGRMTVTLVDTEREFDPANADSPWYDYLKVGIRARLEAQGQPMYTGWLTGWSHDLGRQEAALAFTDALGWAGSQGIGAFTLPAGTTAEQAAAILELGGFAAAFTGGSAFTRGAYAYDGGTVLDALAGPRLAELAAVHAAPDGTIVWRGSAEPYAPGTFGWLNCGAPPDEPGIRLAAVRFDRDERRVRNAVIIAGNAPSRFIDPASISRHGEHPVKSSITELAYG